MPSADTRIRERVSRKDDPTPKLTALICLEAALSGQCDGAHGAETEISRLTLTAKLPFMGRKNPVFTGFYLPVCPDFDKSCAREGGRGEGRPADGTPAHSRDSPTRAPIVKKNEMSEEKKYADGTFNCRECGKSFTVKAREKTQGIYCSHTCKVKGMSAKRQEQRELKKIESLDGVVTKMAKGEITFSPAKAAALRNDVSRLVTKHIRMADEVVQGTRTWSPTQARVFATLLNKVLPDLTAGFVQHEHTVKSAIELTREELERIAAGADDLTDVEYTDVDKEHAEGRPHHEHDAQ